MRRNIETNKDKETGALMAPYDALPANGIIRYAGKIKLHGVNSAVSKFRGCYFSLAAIFLFLSFLMICLNLQMCTSDLCGLARQLEDSEPQHFP